MFMLLKAVYSGILQAYHAKGSSWQSRLMLVMVRVLMKKDVRLQNTQDELLEIARERAASVATIPPAPDDVAVREIALPSLKIESTLVGNHGWRFVLIQPRGETRKSDAFCLYFHGGAYSNTATPQHLQFVYELCSRTGCSFLLPLYPRPPASAISHKEVYATLLELVNLFNSQRLASMSPDEQNLHVEAQNASQLVLMGDSAGGGMALALYLQLLKDGGTGRLPDKVVLISPWLDATMSNPNISKYNAQDPWLTVPYLRLAARLWAGSTDTATDLKALLVSPGMVSDAALAKVQETKTRTLMFCGTSDLFYPDCLAFSERMKTLGNKDCTFVTGRGQVHVYPIMPTFIPEVKEARQLICDFLKST